VTRTLRSCLIAAVFFVGANAVHAATGLAMLKTELGARPAGMAAAFVSISETPDAVFYNPANAAGITKFTASFGHTSYWKNIRLESGYVAAQLHSRLYVHGGIRFAVDDNIENREFPTLEPDDFSDAHDVSLKAGLAYRFSERVAAGLAAGWFIEKIGGWRGSAFNIDLGVKAAPKDNVSLGASVTNLGSDFNLEMNGVVGSDDISLPITYRLGGSYRYESYLGALDFLVLDDEFHVHVGAEAQLHELFTLRAGYMFNYDTKNFTAGASFTKRNMTIDYAFVPYSNNLGTSHMFNFTFSL
jgi:hypothetical protein